MVSKVQNYNFTRYIYQNTFISNKDRNTFYNPSKMIKGNFDGFVLSNTIYPFGLPINRDNNKLSIHIVIEAFKGFNSNSKGVVFYLQNEVPNIQDETGLRPTRFVHAYYGDFYKYNNDGSKSRDLVLCQVIPKTKQLIIDVYYGFYPKTNKERLKIINGHIWHKKTTLKSGLKSFKTFAAINK